MFKRGGELANKAQKHDWNELKKDWLLGEYKSLVKFAEHHGIKYGYVKQQAAKAKWYEEKRTMKELKTNEIVKKTVAAEIENEVSRNAKHLQTYDLALNACTKILQEELNKGIDVFGNEYKSSVIIHSKLARIVEALEKIQKGQRLAEGLDLETPIVDTEDVYELPSRVIASSFVDINRSINDNEYLEYVLCGGRGSTKSSYISLKIFELLINNPETHAVIVRKVKDTLRESVYAQMVWAISELKLDSVFKCTVSPMEIIYKPTGQKIYFRGADDEAKIKSIKVPFGYIGIIWYEELDQFNGDEQIRNITQSAIRGGDTAYIFKSFNPPITQSNWANKYVLLSKENRLVHKSTYLNVPPKWLGKPFIDEAEHLKEINEKAYRHEYLGEPIGNGGNVFENVITRPIDDDEIARFDRIYQGIDWGYYPDPFHFGRMHFDSARRDLYIFAEYRDWKKGNQQTFDKLLELFPDVGVFSLIADSAEQKSVADYRSWGMYNIRGAVKGPNSVEYGCKWLQSLNQIIIDPVRCPYTAQEFLEYEYERNKEGEVISGYPDKDNHSIDMVRYALEPVWRRRGK